MQNLFLRLFINTYIAGLLKVRGLYDFTSDSDVMKICHYHSNLQHKIEGTCVKYMCDIHDMAINGKALMRSNHTRKSMDRVHTL